MNWFKFIVNIVKPTKEKHLALTFHGHDTEVLNNACPLRLLSARGLLQGWTHPSSVNCTHTSPVHTPYFHSTSKAMEIPGLLGPARRIVWKRSPRHECLRKVAVLYWHEALGLVSIQITIQGMVAFGHQLALSINAYLKHTSRYYLFSIDFTMWFLTMHCYC